MSGKTAIDHEHELPAGGWHELVRFGVKLGLPAGLAGMLALGSDRPLVLWLALFQAFATATAVLSAAVAIGGSAKAHAARHWREALGFALAAFLAHLALVALR
ncbi:MAG TPA: hypothetical protein VGU20_31890 [Stellaceae bacterium]|nr:hypothetical protein [Stellaceae bacterium]